MRSKCYTPFLFGCLVGVFVFSVLDQFMYQMEPRFQSEIGSKRTASKLSIASERNEPETDQSNSDPLVVNLVKVLKQHAKDNVIIISSVDYGYIDLGLNLYHSSFKRFQLDNYVFVASDPQVCPILERQSINCVDYVHVADSNTASKFYTESFMLKSYMKTNIVTQALKHGLTVFLVDVDMVFMQNPFDHFPCPECDVQMMTEWKTNSVVNTGFYIARPTKPTIRLHEESLEYMTNKTKRNNTHGSDQKYINIVLKEMVDKKQIKSVLLDENIFSNAMIFFEHGKRFFNGQNISKDVVVVHNNFIISLAAKVYRFKEYGMWHLDKNGYYSNKNAKYIIYDNPIKITPKTDLAATVIRETNALKTALMMGFLMKRIVILPSFHNYRQICTSLNRGCSDQWENCSLQGLYFIETFDKYFDGAYREHSFLSHPLVPHFIKNPKSMSPIYLFDTDYMKNELHTVPRNVTVLSLRRPKEGVFQDEIANLFNDHTSRYPVLRFHSLYLNFTDIKQLAGKFIKGFTRTTYTQHFTGMSFLKKFNLTA